ncbi:hypothetical protein GCM10025863_31760 [Microbacterium suwonense]|uniref:2-succinyl-5-enolpyruvyl-6-hydroxy-3-cyclohexene-1-carboxylate synthase n=1 Tax=Microbacterium suwonense TaxID=683047 RepID=A0ABM8FY37_9MICO|nr:hypothetical protein GCM10025863_31760 [Microbacterium suwonense]
MRRGGEELNLNGRTHAVAAVTVSEGAADRQWLGAWMNASAAQAVDLSAPAPDQDGLSSEDKAARLSAVRAELEAVRRRVDREILADAVWRATWPHDRLVFGSSRLVRVADEVLGGKKVPVHANRGLAGIDGTIATALGIALASQAEGAAGITRVLLGDLAFLHDVGALLLPADEPRPRIQVIVGNDGGGTIFDGLEVAGSAPRSISTARSTRRTRRTCRSSPPPTAGSSRRSPRDRRWTRRSPRRRRARRSSRSPWSAESRAGPARRCGGPVRADAEGSGVTDGRLRCLEAAKCAT